MTTNIRISTDKTTRGLKISVDGMPPKYFGNLVDALNELSNLLGLNAVETRVLLGRLASS